MQEARVRWLDEVRSELSKIAPEEDFDAVMAAGTIQYMVRSQFTARGKKTKRNGALTRACARSPC